MYTKLKRPIGNCIDCGIEMEKRGNRKRCVKCGNILHKLKMKEIGNIRKQNKLDLLNKLNNDTTKI